MVRNLNTEPTEEELKARREAARYIKPTNNFTYGEVFPLEGSYPTDREERSWTGDKPDSCPAFPR